MPKPHLASGLTCVHSLELETRRMAVDYRVLLTRERPRIRNTATVNYQLVPRYLRSVISAMVDCVLAKDYVTSRYKQKWNFCVAEMVLDAERNV